MASNAAQTRQLRRALLGVCLTCCLIFTALQASMCCVRSRLLPMQRRLSEALLLLRCQAYFCTR
jgi:hypothetical protein